MGSTIGLPIETHDVDHTDLVDRRRQEVHLRPDERRILVRCITGKEGHFHGTTACKFVVEFALNEREDVRRPIRDVEVETTIPRFHVASRHRALEPAPDDAAQGVHGRVRPHELVATVPVDVSMDDGPGLWQRAIQPMPHAIRVLGHPCHDESVVANPQFTEIMGLPSPTWIEHGRIQEHSPVVLVGADDRSFHVTGIGVRAVDLLRHEFQTRRTTLGPGSHANANRAGNVSLVNTDVLVIGGGIAGVSVAASLAPKLDVTLVETEATLGYHATGRSAALYTERYGYGTIRNLARASRSFLTTGDPPLVADRGLIFVAPSTDSSALDELEHEFGPPGPWFHRLSPAEVERFCPLFPASTVAGGMYEPDAGDIDVDGLQTTFVGTARGAGATILTSTRVDAISRSGHRWVVTGVDAESPDAPQRITAKIIVNAAGAWGDHVADLAAVPGLGLQPLVRSVFTFDPGRDASGWPMVVDAREQWYIKPEGPFMLGSAASEIPSEPLDARAPEIDVALGIERINAATTLSIRSVRNTWAGLRTFTPDRIPAVGFDDAHDGFFWLVGQGGYGIKTSPAIGRLAAGLIVDGRVPDDISAFGITEAELSPRRLR